MYTFNGEVTLPDDTPLTASQLIQAALEARTFDSAQQKTDTKSRFYNAFALELIVRPIDDDVVTMDAWRRVTNGVVDADFDTSDFDTGEPLPQNAVKTIRPAALASRLFYQDTGGDVLMAFECSLV